MVIIREHKLGKGEWTIAYTHACIHICTHVSCVQSACGGCNSVTCIMLIEN